MKILKKRALAAIIDVFVLGLIIGFVQFLNPNLFGDKGYLLILFIIPLFLRDILFRNASLGKVLCRISVYDNDWKAPSLWLLIKRSFLTATIGYGIFMKSKFIDGGIVSLFDWERDALGTRVIDKRVYKELEIIAKNRNGDFAKNMTELYNEYLRGLYLK
ncbi:MAG: RDD family protein [Clostridia bacterium]|nr:RDD family protein [Clostridia bacterium]